MNATTRLAKEARALMWPWVALTLFGAMLAAVPRAGRSFGFYPESLLLWRWAALWLGLPLLATLSIGHEFQHGTTPLLFAQPVDRIRIWREKWFVLVPAITVAAYLNFTRLDRQAGMLAIVWVVTATCTATFWTLVGRSVLNGLVLNLIQGFVLFEIWQSAEHVLQQSALFPAIVLVTGYSLLMLGLGRRKFIRFEVAGGSATADLVVPGFGAASRTRGLLRSRPEQPLLNLVRKEARLLWLVWYLIVATILGVLCLAALQFVPGYSPQSVQTLVSSFLLAVPTLTAILTGSMAMGEERSSGTSSWHHTLPVSGVTQWLVKVGAVLALSFLALILPVMIATFTVGVEVGVPFGFNVGDNGVLALFIFSSLIGFAGFWCACAVKGTIRAALLTVPAMAFVLLALRPGPFVTSGLIGTGMMDAFVVTSPPRFWPDASGFSWLIDGFWILSVLVAVFQSYRLFRREVTDSLYPFLRFLLILAIVAFLWGSAAWLPIMLRTRTDVLMYNAFSQVNSAILTLHLDVDPPEAGRARQFTAEDLAKGSPFSDKSRKLLRAGTVSVSRNVGRRRRFAYTTTIRFTNGLTCQTDGPDLVGCEKHPAK